MAIDHRAYMLSLSFPFFHTCTYLSNNLHTYLPTYYLPTYFAGVQRKRDSDQKQRVKNNKREFIEKMLPLVDAFRSAPLLAPAVTEKELSMHKTYGALLDNILAVFQKFGYKEFDIGNNQ
jgi:hypothetical protein